MSGSVEEAPIVERSLEKHPKTRFLRLAGHALLAQTVAAVGLWSLAFVPVSKVYGGEPPPQLFSISAVGAGGSFALSSALAQLIRDGAVGLRPVQVPTKFGIEATILDDYGLPS
jgi:hypothetical protein